MNNSSWNLTKRINSLTLTSKSTAALTLEKAMTGTQMNMAIREHGEKPMLALLMHLINQTIKLIPSSMSPVEIKAAGEMLIRKYWMWRVNEFIIMFRDGTTQSFGKEGKVFGQLSAKDIFNWADLYNHRRDTELEILREQKHQEKKYTSPINDIHPDVAAALIKTLDTIPKKKREPQNVISKLVREKINHIAKQIAQ